MQYFLLSMKYKLQYPWDDLFPAVLISNTFAQVILITAIEGLKVEDKKDQFKRKVGWSETDSNGSEVSVTRTSNQCSMFFCFLKSNMF